MNHEVLASCSHSPSVSQHTHKVLASLSHSSLYALRALCVYIEFVLHSSVRETTRTTIFSTLENKFFESN